MRRELQRDSMRKVNYISLGVYGFKQFYFWLIHLIQNRQQQKSIQESSLLTFKCDKVYILTQRVQNNNESSAN